jgi:ribosomal protein L12E/L44/L45/RPP1/RPP2
VQIDAAAAAAEWKESDMNQHKARKQVHKIFFCSGKEEEQEEEEKEEEGHSQFLEKLVVLNENWN